METVEVVIKIPKRTYDRVSERGIIAFGEDAYYIGHAIKNGTVLPKGHGRLIDASKLHRSIEHGLDGTIFSFVPYSDVDTTPTIIEADKDGE